MSSLTAKLCNLFRIFISFYLFFPDNLYATLFDVYINYGYPGTFSNLIDKDSLKFVESLKSPRYRLNG